MSRPCATSVSASAARRASGGRASRSSAVSASALISSRGSRMNWSMALTSAPTSVATLSCRPRSWLACVKYASEFWSSALSDLNASTRASCSTASATSPRRRLLDARAGAAVRSGGRDAQDLDGFAHAPTGADQRIIVWKQPGARPQHVTMKRCIIQGQLVERLKDTFVQDRIGARAAHEEISERQQQTRQDRHQPPDRSGHESESGASGRPWYSPVRV